jgi:hypothetical protein
MADTVQFKNKNARALVGETGQSGTWEPGEVVEIDRDEALRLQKAGQGKIIDPKAKTAA